jgi:phage protein D
MAAQNEVWLTMWIDGNPYEDALSRILSLEIDERSEEASSFHLSLDMAPVAGDWDLLADGRFALLHQVVFELGIGPVGADAPTTRTTLFQGYIVGVEPRFGAARVPDSSLELFGLDASCLMHIDERTRTWSGMSDSDIVRTIYESYGFSTDVTATAPPRSPERGPLVQRGTDAELIRWLARRNGFEAYVERSDAPLTAGGASGREIVGHFHPPRVDQAPQPALALTPRERPSLIEMSARWESHRPTAVVGAHIDERTRRVRTTRVDEPRYKRMGSTSRADILKKRLAEVLPSRPGVEATSRQIVDVPYDQRELENLAWADFRDADWLAVGCGVVDGLRHPAIVRARRPIEVAGAGKLLDGRWYVRGARHRWIRDSATKRYEVDVDLTRNALNGVG